MEIVTSGQPCIYIHDACVLLDMIEGNLLEPWFQLGFETRTTHLVFQEIIDPEQAQLLQKYVTDNKLHLEVIAANVLPQLSQQAAAWRVSMQDASVAYLAKKCGGVLLSGDKRLRQKSTAAGIIVHGILWVLDTLVDNALFTGQEAIQSLDAILAAGGRMPKKECEERRKKWQGL